MLKVQTNKDAQEFSKKILDFLEVRSFLAVYEFVVKSKVCPETSSKEWFDALCYMHTKGWLYLHSEDGKIACVAGAYRVRDTDNLDVMPAEDEGDILYVPFCASTSSDPLVLRKMMEKCVKQYPNVKEAVFYERNSDKKFKRFAVNQEAVK